MLAAHPERRVTTTQSPILNNRCIAIGSGTFKEFKGFKSGKRTKGCVWEVKVWVPKSDVLPSLFAGMVAGERARAQQKLGDFAISNEAL